MTATPDPAAALLEARYGKDWRTKLQIKDHPHADTDESAFIELFPDYPAACERSTWGMAA